MRVPVLTPWTHNGVDQPVGSFVELEENLVRQLRGTVGQEDVPAEADANAVRQPALPAPFADQ